ncbi:hypothetical protein OE749_02080 [Aestuariibacter sp. AA17]|uniref:PKD domain-containing protein n=1 Tax=Fluctibacter corallii TaxID=2984329 RepID=A0ABT3A466_9ALTE|nr:hypothetical protein [Aestuariibacter sp. AA17]MCV2883485.1 hypothetical protein [Aestuariibacter sp. AA17]
MWKNSVLPTRWCSSFFLALILSGCGGGSSTNEPLPDDSQPTQKERVYGVFSSAPVVGVEYTTSDGFSGKTDSQGRFSYTPGTKISFNIADIVLPDTPAKDTITPLDIFNTVNHADPHVINLVRLLYTLDDDGDVHDSVNLASKRVEAISKAGITRQHLLESVTEFEWIYTSLMSNSGVSNVELVDANEALLTFMESMNNSVQLDSDLDGIVNRDDTDDDNDGILDEKDGFPWSTFALNDFDHDGLANDTDNDDDNDGVLDIEDEQSELKFTLGEFDEYTLLPVSGYVVTLNKNTKSLKAYRLNTGMVVGDVQFDQTPTSLTAHEAKGIIYVSTIGDTGPDQLFSINLSSFEKTRVDVSNESARYSLRNLKWLGRDTLFFGRPDNYSGQMYFYDVSQKETRQTLPYSYIHGVAFSQSKSTLVDYWLHSGFYEELDLSQDEIKRLSKDVVSYRRVGNTYEEIARSKISDINRVWVLPTESHFISERGVIYDVESLQEKGQLPNISEVQSISYDLNNHLGIALSIDSTLHYFDLESFEVVKQEAIDETTKDITVVDEMLYQIGQNENQQGYIAKRLLACESCNGNTVPQPQIKYSVITDRETSSYHVQLSAIDTNNPNNNETLMYRWGYLDTVENIVIWNTEFSSDPKMNIRYVAPGEKSIYLQIKNGMNQVSSVHVNVPIESAQFAVRSINKPVSEIGGSALEQSIYDSTRNTLYVLDSNAKRLYFMNAKTLIAEHYIDFALTPEVISLTPDQNRLLISISDTPFDGSAKTPYFYSNKDSISKGAENYVVTIDLESTTITNVYAAPVYISQLQVIQQHVLAVATEFNQLHLLNLDTGAPELRHISRQSDLSHVFDIWGTQVFFPQDDQLFYSNVVLADSQDPNEAEFRIAYGTLTDQDIAIQFKDDFAHYIASERNMWVSPNGAQIFDEFGHLTTSASSKPTRYLSALVLNDETIVDIAFDEENKLMFVLDSSGGVRYYNSDNLFLLGQIDNVNAQRIVLTEDGLLRLQHSEQGKLDFSVLNHLDPEYGQSLKPTADFSVQFRIENGYVKHLFDASGSHNNGAEDRLVYRWDVNSDGLWDTEYTESNQLSYLFQVAGKHHVTLEVRNEKGMTDSVTKPIDVSDRLVSGVPVLDTTPYQFEFAVSELLFDEERQVLYVSSRKDKRVYLVGLNSGLVEHYFQFQYIPQKMTFSSDKAFLHIALSEVELPTANSPLHGTFQRPYLGQLATIDLNSGVQTYVVPLETAAFDLEPLTDNTLLYSSGISTTFCEIDAKTGVPISDEACFVDGAIASTLHFSKQANSLFVSGLDYFGTEKFESLILKLGADKAPDNVFFVDETKEHISEDYEGSSSWLSADETTVIVENGMVINLVQQRVVNTISGQIRDLVFNERLNQYVALYDDRLIVFDLQTHEQIRVIERSDVTHLITVGSTLHVITTHNGISAIEHVSIN